MDELQRGIDQLHRRMTKAAANYTFGEDVAKALEDAQGPAEEEHPRVRIRIHPEGGWGVQEWKVWGQEVDEEAYQAALDRYRDDMKSGSWAGVYLSGPLSFHYAKAAPPSWNWTGFLFDSPGKAKRWLKRFLRVEALRKSLPATHPNSTRTLDDPLATP